MTLTFLHPEYFAVLARHGVTHIFNSWEGMPPVHEQMALPGSHTNPALTAARFLLKPGRDCETAVDTFEPYTETKEVYPEARAAGTTLIEEGLANPGRKVFVLANNRLEGNAPNTIQAMVEGVKGGL